jgi:glycosyltransferase involved in cell wall biosynthesis
VLDAFYPGWKDNGKFAVVRNGVDLNKFSPDVSGQSIRQELVVSSDCIMIGHVGSFRSAKNHKVLLQSFAKLKAQLDNVHLLLVGDGSMRDNIENLIKQLGIAEHVTLAGVRKDVPKMLAAMDIFFYPSIYEGMPNALIEAMACGLPILASNIPEIVEIIPTELSEQLIDPNDVTGFVEALRKLVTDKTSRKKMGFVGRTHVERHFELSVSAEKLCSYWAAEL